MIAATLACVMCLVGLPNLEEKIELLGSLYVNAKYDEFEKVLSTLNAESAEVTSCERELPSSTAIDAVLRLYMARIQNSLADDSRALQYLIQQDGDLRKVELGGAPGHTADYETVESDDGDEVTDVLATLASYTGSPKIYWYVWHSDVSVANDYLTNLYGMQTLDVLLSAQPHTGTGCPDLFRGENGVYLDHYRAFELLWKIFQKHRVLKEDYYEKVYKFIIENSSFYRDCRPIIDGKPFYSRNRDYGVSMMCLDMLELFQDTFSIEGVLEKIGQDSPTLRSSPQYAGKAESIPYRIRAVKISRDGFK